jgi:hypothetical protein
MKEDESFKYHSHEELKNFIGHEISFVGLDDKIKTGVLTFEKGKYCLPESDGVNACTVKTYLPMDNTNNSNLNEPKKYAVFNISRLDSIEFRIGVKTDENKNKLFSIITCIVDNETGNVIWDEYSTVLEDKMSLKDLKEYYEQAKQAFEKPFINLNNFPELYET